MRSKALQKVCAAVSLFRPGITEDECSVKFRNLRNQYNIEKTKIKASIKSRRRRRKGIMESTCNTSKKKRWTKEAVHTLIEAYKK